MSGWHKDDLEDTKYQLDSPCPVVKNKTWLRHKVNGESGLIDLMILKGNLSIDEMINELSLNNTLKTKNKTQWEKRIRDHILHLSTSDGDSRNRAAGHGGHKLPVIETNDGKIAFGVK
jgi:hypothetical protein